MTVPSKQAEFEAFLKLIKNGQQAHWIEIAHILNIDKDTVTAWKLIPEAQDAIRRGVAKSLKEMETAGKKDWRMWESKLKMLGLNPAQKIEANISDPASRVLEALGLKENGDAGETSDTSQATPQDNP